MFEERGQSEVIVTADHVSHRPLLAPLNGAEWWGSLNLFFCSFPLGLVHPQAAGVGAEHHSGSPEEVREDQLTPAWFIAAALPIIPGAVCLLPYAWIGQF